MVEQEEQEAFQKILSFILAKKDFNGEFYKAKYIQRRVMARMRVYGISHYNDYLKILFNDSEEIQHLFERLTIHVTEFFRDPSVYTAIETLVFNSLKPDGRNDHFKILSVGCSTGEEAYSIAILALKYFKFFKVHAIDIDPQSVQFALNGEYQLSATRNLTKIQIQNWFQEIGSGKIKVLPKLARRVEFQIQNIFSLNVFELNAYNLILCRNVLIYLTQDKQQWLFKALHESLKDNGVLVLGNTETMMGPARQLFICIDTSNRLYQKTIMIN
jgi:chemotaxis methyl-accepting protein methylase